MAAGAAALAFPAAAQAAALSVIPVKPCYRSSETIGMFGSGYTPDSGVSITSDGRSIGSTTADSAGNFAGRLQVAAPTERVKTYTATDQSNPSNFASAPLRISPLDVEITPRTGAPGRVLRIAARGFTTGARLYAHVVRGRRRVNLRIGLLRGPCRKLSVRKRLFPARTAPGTYLVQFDTRPGYSRATPVKVRFRVAVYPVFGARATQISISG